MSTPDEPRDTAPIPPESWPGAGGRRSVAPAVPSWPGLPVETDSEPGSSWPGAEPRGAAVSHAAIAADLDAPQVRDAALRDPAWQVSPRAKIGWRIATALSWVWILGGLGTWMVFDPERRAWQWPVLAVVLAWVLFALIVVPWWRYKVHRWEITDAAVYTQVGWFSQARRVAPISRIQTVDSEFGPIERMLGLGTLTVTTASAAGALRVSGLERATVLRLVEELTATAAQMRGDAT